VSALARRRLKSTAAFASPALPRKRLRQGDAACRWRIGFGVAGKDCTVVSPRHDQNRICAMRAAGNRGCNPKKRHHE
jgi:hypothetical protein